MLCDEEINYRSVRPAKDAVERRATRVDRWK
jgi:hypothetical protein